MGTTKKCPYCGEEIMADARKCRHCGEWLDDNVELKEDLVRKLDKQEPENQQKKYPIIDSTLTSSHVATNNKVKFKSSKILFVILAIIAVALAVVAIYLFSGDNKTTDKATKKELEEQFLDAFNEGTVYDIMTPEFEEVVNGAYGLRESHVTSCFADYLSLLFDYGFEIKIEKITILGLDKAEIHALSNEESPVFIMVRDARSINNDKSKWLIDDICSCFGLSSMKFSVMDCINNTNWEKVMSEFQAENDEGNGLLHHFIGQIAGAKIHMSIMVDGLMVQGRYYYDSKRAEGDKASLSLYGNCNGSNLRLTESVNNMVTGVFEGEWNNEIYEGTFTRMKDGKGFSFRLVETEGGADFFAEYEIVAE